MNRKFKYMLSAFLMAIHVVSVGAVEKRTFYSADKSKSFEATLMEYHPRKKVVTVVFASGKRKTFPLDILSEGCQNHVLANADLLAISKSVRLGFKEVKEKGGGEGVATGYAIEVSNNSDRPIDEVTLKYTMYYNQGDLKKGGAVSKTKTGTLRTEKLYSHDRLTVQTGKVDIVRKSVPPSGGG